MKYLSFAQQRVHGSFVDTISKLLSAIQILNVINQHL